ncbi:MAG: TIGR00159 family protein [Candidatus Hydrothermota bacterium]|nr:MAG: TIGR00159 family protein [Candidatus Hydrothermae bacterium]
MEFLKPGLNDILDIFIVAFIFYQILKLFRGTRATYMLWGILVIVFFALLAQFLNMEALKWLISAVETIALIALIVVFQPEIRKALMELGKNPRIRAFFFKEEAFRQVPVDEIVKAVFDLREHGLGAIVVIERAVGLRDYVEDAGVEIDAKVSAPLIMAIFTPPGPLHDGALIVRGERIIGAGVVLPLSDNPELDPSFGTRHRAALGITELSDALAIVVSEERKSVRVAYQGSFTPPHTRDSLRKFLNEMLRGEEGA